MRVILTGATGFIGSHLLDKLISSGADVTCFVRGNSSLKWLEGKKCRIERVDFLVEDSIARHLADAEYIFHIAGVIRGKTDQEFYTGNHITTRNLVHWTCKHSSRIKRFIQFSSLAVTGPSLDGIPVNESSPKRPVSIYGVSKMLAEQEVLKMRDRLPVTIIRPPIVYGIRDSALEMFYKLVAKGFLPLLGSRKYFSIVHVDDLLSGTLELLRHEAAKGEVYFISDPSQYSFDELASSVSRSLGKKPLRIRIGDYMILMMGSFFTSVLKPLGINSIFSRDKAVEICQKYWTCSSKKIEEHIGFKAKIDLQSGMRDTIKWYLKQGVI